MAITSFKPSTRSAPGKGLLSFFPERFQLNSAEADSRLSTRPLMTGSSDATSIRANFTDELPQLITSTDFIPPIACSPGASISDFPSLLIISLPPMESFVK
jgi:hypothetical protein